MRKVIFAAVVIAGVLGLGANVTTFPSLFAPRVVEEGATFAVKGSGFLPSTPLMVCEPNFTACQPTATDPHGEFLQLRVAPPVSGSLSLKAIQFPVTRGGTTSGKGLTASVTLVVKEAPTAEIGTESQGGKTY